MLFTILPPGPVTTPNDGRDAFEHDNVQLASAFRKQRENGASLFVMLSESSGHSLALVKDLLLAEDGSLLADVWPHHGTGLEILKDYSVLMPTLLAKETTEGRLRAVRVSSLYPTNSPALEVQQ